MPPRDWKLRIQDIVEAVEKIDDYTAGMTIESCTNDRKTVDAVLRNITIIGEAARHVPAEVLDRYPEIPWAKLHL